MFTVARQQADTGRDRPKLFAASIRHKLRGALFGTNQRRHHMLEAYCTSGSSPTNGGEPYFHRENHGSVFLLRAVFPAAFPSIERQILEETMWFSDAFTTE